MLTVKVRIEFATHRLRNCIPGSRTVRHFKGGDTYPIGHLKHCAAISEQRYRHLRHTPGYSDDEAARGTKPDDYH